MVIKIQKATINNNFFAYVIQLLVSRFEFPLQFERETVNAPNLLHIRPWTIVSFFFFTFVPSIRKYLRIHMPKGLRLIDSLTYRKATSTIENYSEDSYVW